MRRPKARTIAFFIISVAAVLAAQSKSVWQGVYTEEQAEQGKAGYEAQCSFCHLPDLTGQGFAPALIDDTFRIRWEDGKLGDLFSVVKQTMPQDKPGSLSDQQYAEIVAFLLKSNRYPAGSRELPPDQAALNDVGFKKP